LFIDLFSCLSLERGVMEADTLLLVPVALGGWEDEPVALAGLHTGMCIEQAWRFNPSFGG
jgi:hypothetical protein